MIPDSLSRLKTVRSRTAELIGGRTQEEIDRRPEKHRWRLGEAGDWSVGEVIDHIVRVMRSLSGEIELLIELKETGGNPEIARGIKDYAVSPVFIPKQLMPVAEPFFKLSNSISAAVLPFGLRQGFIRSRNFPIRNPAQWLPARGRAVVELRSELEDSMARLEWLIQEHASIDYDDLVLNHSIFGRFTVTQLLDILALHEEWHQPDIEKLLV